MAVLDIPRLISSVAIVWRKRCGLNSIGRPDRSRMSHSATQRRRRRRISPASTCLCPSGLASLGGQQPRRLRRSARGRALLGADLLGDLGRDRHQVLVVALVIEVGQPRLPARVDRQAVELQRARRADPQPGVAHDQERDPRGGIGQARPVGRVVELARSRARRRSAAAAGRCAAPARRADSTPTLRSSRSQAPARVTASCPATPVDARARRPSRAGRARAPR